MGVQIRCTFTYPPFWLQTLAPQTYRALREPSSSRTQCSSAPHDQVKQTSPNGKMPELEPEARGDFRNLGRCRALGSRLPNNFSTAATATITARNGWGRGFGRKGKRAGRGSSRRSGGSTSASATTTV